MSNDPKTDLIYAILAMDSYNRGYGAGINGLLDTTSSKIGSYTVYDSKGDAQAFTAGFYAIAYQSGDDFVISYRGTDNKGIFDSEQLGGSDPLFGYGLALGWTGFQDYNSSSLNEARITTQSRLAADFYRAVTDVATDGVAAVNVTLTGHSLGGGLAGYLSVTTGTQSVLFDHLPFDVSGVVRAGQLGVEAQFEKARGYFTQGEFLQFARNGDLQSVAGGVLGGLATLIPVLGPVIGAITAAYGGTLGGATAALEAGIDKTQILLKSQPQIWAIGADGEQSPTWSCISPRTNRGSSTVPNW